MRDCIEKHLGILTSVCCELDCTWLQLQHAIKHWGLEQFVQGAKRQFISRAEQVLLSALDNPRDALDAAKFILTTQGKDVGWSRDPNTQIAVQVSAGDKAAQIRAIFGIGTQEQAENK